MSDDGVGVFAARRARELLEPGEAVMVREAEIAGFGLLDLLEGFASAVIVDALHHPELEPGEIAELDEGSFAAASHLVTGHQIDLPTALELGREMKRSVPDRIAIVGVQIADDLTMGERCTPPVEAAVEAAARRALEIARCFLAEGAAND